MYKLSQRGAKKEEMQISTSTSMLVPDGALIKCCKLTKTKSPLCKSLTFSYF